MKNLLISVLVLLTVISDSVMGMTGNADEDGWQLVFSDEFNGRNGSQPDSTKWVRCIRYNAGWNRWISSSKDVVFVKNGKLVCRAMPNRSEPHDTACMLTGAIETRGKFSFQYGKVEVRMKTNLKRGNFPAIWLRTWPTPKQPLYSEIDIMEVFGNRKISSHTAHSQLTTSRKDHGERNTFNYPCDVTKWHVYGVIWTSENIIWTVDGVKVGEYRKSTDPTLLAEGQWSFDYPLFIILNQSVGMGGPDYFMPQIHKTYETQFDWVRVYQRI